MAIIKSKTVLGQAPAPTVFDATPCQVYESVSLTAGQVAANNQVYLAVLPADADLIGYTLNADDLDSATTVTMDLGIFDNTGLAISTAAADGGAKWLTASTLAQAGGIALHTASKATYDIVQAVTPVPYDRIVGVVFPAGSTGQAGKLGLELVYRAGRNN